jgi:hypothetical protein
VIVDDRAVVRRREQQIVVVVQVRSYGVRLVSLLSSHIGPNDSVGSDAGLVMQAMLGGVAILRREV